MRRHQFGLTLLALSFVCLTACAGPNQEARKKQAHASRVLGEAYYGQGKYTLALRELLKAKELNPDDQILHDDLGLTYMAKGRLDLAIKHFKKALEIDPGYAPAKNNLGTVYLRKEDWDTAIKHFKEVSEDVLYLTPQFPLSNLGWCYYNKGEYELAVKYYREALEISPKLFYALRGLGVTYIAMGKGSEAVATLEVGVKQYPRIAQLHFDLGEAYTLLSQYKKAFNEFQKVIELVPNTPLARQANIESQKVKNIR
jgi:tetratricopeptide (TPR) repeat protein